MSEAGTADTASAVSAGRRAETPPEPDRGDRLARLLQRITVLANESVDVEEALCRTVTDICDTMGWPAGQAVVVGEDASFVPVGPLHRSDVGSTGAGDRLLELADREDSPVATVLSSGQPLRLGPLELGAGDDSESDEDDIAMWLGFPVTVGGEVEAILHFVTTGPVAPDEGFVEIMAGVGQQLGVLIERNQARTWLEDVNEELERSNRELEQFAYVASHDLQEPLRKIIGFAELLEDRYADDLTGEAAEFLGYVTDAAFRMRQLIEDLLAYSRAGRRRPTMDAVDLETVVDAAVDDLGAALEESQARLEVQDDLPTVHGNASELRELLVNLIGNAVKYHGEAVPEVRVTTSRRDDGWWRLTVADNGIGIPAEHQDRIFEVFKRLHPRGRYSGTGIGLAVCRQIVHHHGGDIRVESTPGEGAAFHVTLPPAPDADHDSEDPDG